MRSLRQRNSGPADVVGAITSAGLWLGVLGVGAIVVIFLIEICSRYLFNAPTTWASDSISYLLSVSVFLTMPRLAAEGGHVAMTYFLDTLPLRFASVASRILLVLSGLVCVVVAYICCLESLRQMEFGTLTVATQPIPKWWISGFVVYGFAASALHFMVKAAGPIVVERIDREKS